MVFASAVLLARPNSPKLLSPQQRMVPPVSSAQGPAPEAETAVAVTPRLTGPNWSGVIVELGEIVLLPSPSRLAEFDPQQRTEPLLRTAHAATAPTPIDIAVPPRGTIDGDGTVASAS